MTQEQLETREPLVRPDSNCVWWMPVFNLTQPEHIPWSCYESLKRQGGKVVWHAGGIMYLSFVGRDRAIFALKQAISERGGEV